MQMEAHELFGLRKLSYGATIESEVDSVALAGFMPDVERWRQPTFGAII